MKYKSHLKVRAEERNLHAAHNKRKCLGSILCDHELNIGFTMQ